MGYKVKPSVVDWGGGMSVGAPCFQLFARVGNRWPHNAPWYHQLMASSCYLRDCKVLLVMSPDSCNQHCSKNLVFYL